MFQFLHGGCVMFARVAGGLAPLFIALTAFGGDLRTNEMIIGGGSCEVDGMWVSGPSLYLRRDTPGVAVGMVRLAGKGRVFAYVLVIKGDEQRRVVASYDGKRSM